MSERQVQIAVIGMAVNVPGARALDEFWRVITSGDDQSQDITDSDLEQAGVAPELSSKVDYVRRRPKLIQPARFDAEFFNFSAADATVLDPQHRLFLETCFHALEDAALVGQSEVNVGVFAGQSSPTYLIDAALRDSAIASQFQTDNRELLLGGDASALATTVAYKLNLNGPAMGIATACSTSLAAIHVARTSLITGECNAAIAGGVSIKFPHNVGYEYRKGHPLSPDGKCRPFSIGSAGTVLGSGAGAVVLMRLDDALALGKRIDAVIIGSAMNNDGADKVGFTAPSVNGQINVIRAAVQDAQINPSDIGYLEGHGTGTAMGDPMEVAAVSEAWREQTGRLGYCAIGSVKANIGHLDAAAGVASFIKSVLVVKNGEIPPIANLGQPDPNIPWANTPFYAPSEHTGWHHDGATRKVAINALGVGGTNVHVIIEESPQISTKMYEEANLDGPQRIVNRIALTADTKTALSQIGQDLARHVKNHPEILIRDISRTLASRPARKWRALFNVHDGGNTTEEILHGVATSRSDGMPRKPVLLFSGAGSFYPGMCADLYERNPLFRLAFDRCRDAVGLNGEGDLRDIVFERSNSPIETDGLTSSVLLASTFSVQYSIAQVCFGLGIKPKALLGHSFGENIAASVAGVIEPEDAIELAVLRGQLADETPPGSMIVVYGDEQRVSNLIDERYTIAARNGPRNQVISGRQEHMSDLIDVLRKERIACQKIGTTAAGHSPLVDGVMDRYRDALRQFQLRAPSIPIMSTVTGRWLSADEAVSPEYWVRHMRQTVRFSEAIDTLTSNNQWAFIDVGPGQPLKWLLSEISPEHRVVGMVRHKLDPRNDIEVLDNSVKETWESGVDIEVSVSESDLENGTNVSLPPYPFEGVDYWLAKPGQSKVLKRDDTEGKRSPMHQRPAINADFVAPSSPLEQALHRLWCKHLGYENIGVCDNFYELGGHSLLAVKMLTEICELFEVDLAPEQMRSAVTISMLATTIESLVIHKVRELDPIQAKEKLDRIRSQQ